MKIPFKLPFFRQRKLRQVPINNSIGESINADAQGIDEKEELLRTLNELQLEILFFRAELDKDSITLEFVKKLSASPTLLDDLVNNVFEREFIKKINDGTLRISDIKSYKKELFQYDIFAEEDKNLLEILRKETNILDKGYATFGFDEFMEKMNSNDYVDSYIEALIDEEDLLVERKKAVQLTQNKIYSHNMVSIAYPLDNDEIFCEDIFDFYYTGELTFNSDSILFIPYEEFLEWNNDEKKRKILDIVQVIITDDYVKDSEVRYAIKDFSDEYTYNFSNSVDVDKLLIQVNHLLYLIDKIEIDNDLKDYYKYYICKYFTTIKEDTYGGYNTRRKLKKLVDRIKKSLDSEKNREITNEFNQLDIIDKKKKIEPIKFSAKIFLMQFDNLNKMTAFEFLRYVSTLNEEERSEVLSNEVVINKLKGLLKESSYDEYRGYKEICYFLNVDDIFKIFDAEFVRKFYKANREQNQYRFFHTIFDSGNVNQAMEYLLNDDEYFMLFVSCSNYSSGPLVNLSYPIILKLLKKIEVENHNEAHISFIGSLSTTDQLNLLKEDFSNDFLVKIVQNSSKKVQQFFYLEDKRFNYLWDKFNVLDLSSGNYILNDDVVSKNEFFDRFKGTSIVQFRANVNQFLIHQPDIYFEDKITKYEDELISSFDVDSGLFVQYKYLIDNIVFLNNRAFRERGIDFFYDNDTFWECHKYVERDDDGKFYVRNKEGITQYLEWLSKRKLNEVIVDRLFKDNIYNVFLNIKEMLRYNKGLRDEEKLLSDEQVEFYEAILNIDKLDKEVILEIYNKFKDKNVALMFYEDIQKLKSKSYDKIKEDMFQPNDMKGLKDSELSNKYEVTVFDLREKDYVMLVRCLRDRYYEQSYHKRDCYTLLSNENSSVFHDDNYIYGYSGFDNDCVLHVFEGDAYSGDVKWSELSSGSDIVNRIMTSREIATNSSWYSEVQIVNKKSNENNSMFEALRPSFLVVYDEVNDKILEEAKRLNIPICIISHSRKLDESLVSKIPFNDRFGDETHKYTREWGISNESERRRNR